MSRIRLRRGTGMLLTVLLLGACAVPTAAVTPTAALSATAATHILPEFAETLEAWRLLAAYGDQVWPGWGQARIPLLIRSGEYDLLVGHPSPPPGFSLLPGVTAADQPVYRHTGHLVPVPAATAWQVGDVWSVAVPTRAEFQQAIDAQLGTGVVQLDTENYVRAIVHEAFHAYAMDVIKGSVPDFGADVNEGDLIQRLAAQPDLDQQYTAEGQMLAKALQAPDDRSVRQAVSEFLKLRQARRAVGDKDTAAYEQTTEWIEGLARYAEVAVMQHADPAMSAEIWQAFLDQLARPTTSPDGFRGRYYLLGAGQAFLLDRLLPDWKTRALAGKQALETLLAPP